MKELIQERQQTLDQIKALQGRVEEIEDQIFEAIKDQVKDHGSTTIRNNGHKITVTIPMRTSWDEKKLREIADKIRSANDDPEQYIQYKLSVPESKYKAFPDAVRQIFEPARTVKPGKRNIKVEEINGV
jgi:uncharacterized protein (UPF0128 family)